MKRILVTGYSQTGQLHNLLNHFTGPLKEAPDVELVFAPLIPKNAYPFPWPFFQFFDTFPECVFLDAPENQTLELDNQTFDLIILGYQPWFLSPSLPTTAFLKSTQGQKLLQNTSVITVIGCRNMWGQAHLKVQQLLLDAKANLIDNVVLTDQGSSLATFITTPRWLLTGKKEAALGLPAAGIAQQDIENSCRFGLAIRQAIQNQHPLNQSLLTGLGAVKADASLLQSEKIGARSFHIWGKLLRKIGKPNSWQRKPILVIYILFLVVMILTVVPITMLLRKLFAPLIQSRLEKLQSDFEAPSGSNTSRMKELSCPKP